MQEVTDGEYQKYSVEPGSYIRKHFFGKYPALYERVIHLTDDELSNLMRGGHDPKKVYAAYQKAVKNKGRPTVILAKTVKGYGLGEAGEARNIAHQQKKLDEKDLREFRKRFNIPIEDEEIAETPFSRPPKDCPETQYLLKCRNRLGGFIPKRNVNYKALSTPSMDFFSPFLKGSSDQKASTTMAFVRMLRSLLDDKTLGDSIVPIIPDEARTFGMDALFRQYGIYSAVGQRYEPVDFESLLRYKEAKDGQILEEGITEAGSMSSFIAAGTAYANIGIPLIPFYTYYAMFGHQRVGDLMWLAGDSRTRGFLLGATAGRTTLNGEGLQHQDGHSLLTMGTIPAVVTYDPAFAYEIAVLLQSGMERMYKNNEDVMYYLTLYNENYPQPSMPKGAEEGILRGLYKFSSKEDKQHKAHIFGSGPLINAALSAQEILFEEYDVSADVWSATSYQQLRRDALETEHWNRLHPNQKRKQSYLEILLENETGVFAAVSDYIKLVPDQIAPWMPKNFISLGTDGFGRSDTRENLRRFFEIDAESIVIAVLSQFVKRGELKPSVVENAMIKFGYDAEKPHPKNV